MLLKKVTKVLLFKYAQNMKQNSMPKPSNAKMETFSDMQKLKKLISPVSLLGKTLEQNQ